MSDKLFAGPVFNRVALIGIGLIGSSLARVFRRDMPETRIIACARRAETLDTVRRLNLADETTDDPAAAADGADLVVLARFPNEPKKNADAAFAFLQRRGILTRQMSAYGLPECLRITIGTGEEMEAVAAALAEFMAPR